MLIRLAIERDAPSIAQVHIDSWRAAYRGVIPIDVLDNLDVKRRTTQWISNLRGSSIHTIVAEQNGDIVGFASFAATRDEDDDPKRVAEIQAIYVDPESWSRGIGQRLGASAIAEIVAKSYEQVTLWVLKDNQRACHFYEHSGFRLDGTTKSETIGVPLEVIRYRKTFTRTQ